MNHIEKSKIIQYLEDKLSNESKSDVKLALLGIYTQINLGKFDIKIWSD